MSAGEEVSDMHPHPQHPTPRPPSSHVPVMPALTTHHRVGTPRGTAPPATPPTSSSPRSAPRTPRDLCSTAQSGRRCDLLARYEVLHTHDPWAQRTLADVEQFTAEERGRREREREKRAQFARTLAAQIDEHALSKSLESTQRSDEMRRERALFRQYQDEEQRERAAKRSKHLREIEQRKEQLLVTSARREREEALEAKEESERRERAEREREAEREAERQRRERQRAIAQDMWDANLRVKALRERARQEELERDRAMMAEYIRMTDEERRKRAEFIRSRQRPTARAFAATNAELEREAKLQRLIEAQQRHQREEEERIEERHASDAQRKRETRVRNRECLQLQIDERRRRRAAQRDDEVEERHRLEEEAAAFRRAEEEAKRRRAQKAHAYCAELEAQMEAQRERSLLDLIAATPTKVH